MVKFWPREKPFASLHTQKEDNNQSKNNKPPEVPENQTPWNSNSQGIKETVDQTNQTGRRETRETGRWRGPAARPRPLEWVWLNGKLRLRADYGLWWALPWWEKLPVSLESSLETGARAEQASCIVPSLPPPPQTAQQCNKEGCPALVNT